MIGIEVAQDEEIEVTNAMSTKRRRQLSRRLSAIDQASERRLFRFVRREHLKQCRVTMSDTKSRELKHDLVSPWAPPGDQALRQSRASRGGGRGLLCGRR